MFNKKSIIISLLVTGVVGMGIPTAVYAESPSDSGVTYSDYQEAFAAQAEYDFNRGFGGFDSDDVRMGEVYITDDDTPTFVEEFPDGSYAFYTYADNQLYNPLSIDAGAENGAQYYENKIGYNEYWNNIWVEQEGIDENGPYRLKAAYAFTEDRKSVELVLSIRSEDDGETWYNDGKLMTEEEVDEATRLTPEDIECYYFYWDFMTSRL